jgi:hypothetical protein
LFFFFCNFGFVWSSLARVYRNIRTNLFVLFVFFKNLFRYDFYILYGRLFYFCQGAQFRVVYFNGIWWSEDVILHRTSRVLCVIFTFPISAKSKRMEEMKGIGLFWVCFVGREKREREGVWLCDIAQLIVIIVKKGLT